MKKITSLWNNATGSIFSSTSSANTSHLRWCLFSIYSPKFSWMILPCQMYFFFKIIGSNSFSQSISNLATSWPLTMFQLKGQSPGTGNGTKPVHVGRLLAERQRGLPPNGLCRILGPTSPRVDRISSLSSWLQLCTPVLIEPTTLQTMPRVIANSTASMVPIMKSRKFEKFWQSHFKAVFSNYTLILKLLHHQQPIIFFNVQKLDIRLFIVTV